VFTAIPVWAGPLSAEAVSACKRRDLSSNRLFTITRNDIIRANLYQSGG